jgi:hypothetical protein
MRILLFGMAALLTVAVAADLATIQPNEVAAQVAAKGAHPVIIHV